MKTVSEIQEAVLALSDAEFAELCKWVLGLDLERCEEESDEDSRGGE